MCTIMCIVIETKVVMTNRIVLLAEFNVYAFYLRPGSGPSAIVLYALKAVRARTLMAVTASVIQLTPGEQTLSWLL